MTKQEAMDRTEFMSRIADEAPKGMTYTEASKAADLICRHGVTYKHICEDQCNGHVDCVWLEKRGGQIERRITALCDSVGVKPVFQGDPRGHTVKIALPSGYTNDWGKEGYCVPTS
jgi:hypothetical protein